MAIPHINFEWNINLGQLIPVVLIILGGIGAYYDLKSDVRNLTTVTQTKFAEYDRAAISQKETDKQIVSDFKGSLDDTKREIRQSFRDFREDIRADRKVK